MAYFACKRSRKSRLYIYWSYFLWFIHLAVLTPSQASLKHHSPIPTTTLSSPWIQRSQLGDCRYGRLPYWMVAAPVSSNREPLMYIRGTNINIERSTFLHQNNKVSLLTIPMTPDVFPPCAEIDRASLLYVCKGLCTTVSPGKENQKVYFYERRERLSKFYRDWTVNRASTSASTSTSTSTHSAAPKSANWVDSAVQVVRCTRALSTNHHHWWWWFCETKTNHSTPTLFLGGTPRHSFRCHHYCHHEPCHAWNTESFGNFQSSAATSLVRDNNRRWKGSKHKATEITRASVFWRGRFFLGLCAPKTKSMLF